MRALTTSFFWALLAASAFGQPKLEGVWQTVEVKTDTGAHAGTVSKTPGMFIFTAKGHYSMAIPLSDARPGLADPTKATAAELLESWGPFLANAGTYEISGDLLTLKPMVAKNPGAVTHAAYIHASFKLSGDILTTAPANPGLVFRRRRDGHAGERSPNLGHQSN